MRLLPRGSFELNPLGLTAQLRPGPRRCWLPGATQGPRSLSEFLVVHGRPGAPGVGGPEGSPGRRIPGGTDRSGAPGGGEQPATPTGLGPAIVGRSGTPTRGSGEN